MTLANTLIYLLENASQVLLSLKSFILGCEKFRGRKVLLGSRRLLGQVAGVIAFQCASDSSVVCQSINFIYAFIRACSDSPQTDLQ